MEPRDLEIVMQIITGGYRVHAMLWSSWAGRAVQVLAALALPVIVTLRWPLVTLEDLVTTALIAFGVCVYAIPVTGAGLLVAVRETTRLLHERRAR